jgi:hypothetical protein
MKKVILILAIIIFAVSPSFAQQGPKNISPEKPILNDPTVMVTQAICPVPSVVLNLTQTQNNNALNIPPANNGNGFLENKKTSGTKRHYRPYQYSNRWDNNWYVPTQQGILSMPPSGTISNSFNTNNYNTYNYGHQLPVKESWCNVCRASGSQHTHMTPPNQETNWFPGFWFWLLAAIGLGLWFWNKRNPIFPPKTDTTPITFAPVIKNYRPVSSRPAEVVTPVMVDPKEAMEMAKAVGGTFETRTDGTFKIDFPKPEPTVEVKEETIKQQ